MALTSAVNSRGIIEAAPCALVPLTAIALTSAVNSRGIIEAPG